LRVLKCSLAISLFAVSTLSENYLELRDLSHSYLAHCQKAVN
jgi:hypothetical protein